MPKALHDLVQSKDFQPSLKSTSVLEHNFSEISWNWHCRHKKIYNRNCFVFIEEASLYTLCFFDLPLREIKNLDICLWFRFLNEIQLMGQNVHPEAIVNEPDVLSLIRSMMTPLQVQYKTSRKMSSRANQVFQVMKTFLQRPLAMPLPLYQEIYFDWLLNTDLLIDHPELMNCLNNKNTLKNDTLTQFLMSSTDSPHFYFFNELHKQCTSCDQKSDNVVLLS